MFCKKIKIHLVYYFTLPVGPQDLRAMQPRGGSGVLPHLRDCLHGERLRHGGLCQRALGGELKVV